MEKKEKKSKKLTEELLEEENNFEKTKTGKFMKVLGAIGCILILLELIISGFEAFVNVKNMDYNQYRALFIWGECFGNSGLLLIIGYFLTFLDYRSEEKREKRRNKKVK